MVEFEREAALNDIFISYSHEDTALARTFAEAFEHEGFSVWWDDGLRAGQTWDEAIETALRGAKAVVVLWSKTSVASRWVRAEATTADRNNTLIPAMIDACDRPIIFELTQTADLIHWRGEADDPAWRAYVDDVARKIRGDAADSEADKRPAVASIASGVPFIVLLPISTRTGDDDLEMIAEDLTNDITTALAKRTMMKVVSSATVAKYRGSIADTSSIGRELGARHMAVAKLQRASGNLRLNIQLLEPSTGDVIWSEKFVRAAQQLADDGEAFVGGVADLIHQHCYQSEVMRAIRLSEGASAWDCFLRSSMVYLRFDSHSISNSIDEARRAIALSPDFGLGHAQLAAALGNLMSWIGHQPEQAEAEVRGHIRRAIDLDKNNWLTLMLAALGHHGLKEYGTALALFEQAKRLNSNQTDLDSILTGIYFSLGHYDKALSVSGEDKRGAEARFGFRTQTLCGQCCYNTGSLEDAQRHLARALQFNPYYLLALKWSAIVSASLGNTTDALDMIRRMQESEPEFTLEMHIAQILYDTPDTTKAETAVAILTELWARLPE
jgi:TolB-like protein/Tfp pilus assembly protein PilF